jgi:hypothetical protein
MSTITFPLTRGMQGRQVADLHNALQVLLDRALIRANDEGARRELAAALRRDLAQQSYGEATEKVVSVFQEERRLQPSGEVDGPTADAFNKLLRELGLLDQERPPAFRLVAGLVRREDGLPLQGARVRATDVSERRETRLGDDTADAEGRYTIRYEALPGVDAVNLKVSAIGEDGRAVVSSEVVPNAKLVETIDLTCPSPRLPRTARRSREPFCSSMGYRQKSSSCVSTGEILAARRPFWTKPRPSATVVMRFHSTPRVGQPASKCVQSSPMARRFRYPSR